MLLETGAIRDRLEDSGFMYRDNFLPSDVFRELNSQVLHSWEKGDGWNTRVKGSVGAKVLPLQTSDNVRKIRLLLDEQIGSCGTGFSYLYHSLHQDNDKTGLITKIRTAVIAGWKTEVTALIGQWDKTNFSLTAFTPFCFLDMHTDYSPDAAQYKITVLLYFGDDGVPSEQADLVFDYHEQKITISALPNRSVLFVPSPKTNHGIPRGHSKFSVQFSRLAFSGWLL